MNPSDPQFKTFKTHALKNVDEDRQLELKQSGKEPVIYSLNGYRYTYKQVRKEIEKESEQGQEFIDMFARSRSEVAAKISILARRKR